MTAAEFIHAASSQSASVASHPAVAWTAGPVGGAVLVTFALQLGGAFERNAGPIEPAGSALVESIAGLREDFKEVSEAVGGLREDIIRQGGEQKRLQDAVLQQSARTDGLMQLISDAFKTLNDRAVWMERTDMKFERVFEKLEELGGGE